MPIAQHHFVPPWPKQQRYSRTSLVKQKDRCQSPVAYLAARVMPTVPTHIVDYLDDHDDSALRMVKMLVTLERLGYG